jgi:hypothetical protein
VAELSERPGALEAVRRARWKAAVAHRAEPLTRVLAEATMVCVTTALVVTVVIALRPDVGPPQVGGTGSGLVGLVYAWVVDAAAWGAGLAGVRVVTGIVGGAVTGRSRPLGLLWDLICFLPRTGHPFGPPCYAERVVPELVRRYGDWLEPTGRRVVVSAHSLGAVLVVASLFATWVEDGRRVLDRIALVTYGVQLRAYFGRMFPELLGPSVLGTAPGRGARLWTPDPWADAIAEDEAAAGPGNRAGRGADLDADGRRAVDETVAPDGPPTVRSLLSTGRTVRWLSLWRRTDYLGFPVDRFVGSPVDEAAEEVDTSGYLAEIATLGGYPRTGAYALALAELRRRL